MAYVVVHAERLPPKRIELKASPVVIGRTKGCTVCISDRRMSREHCKIEQDGERWTLSDLGSSNGTFLNGKRVAEPRTLREDDAIEVGDTKITFHPGRLTSRRPANPLEAMQAQQAMQPQEDVFSDTGTLVGQQLPEVKQETPQPLVRPDGQQVSMPLAFTRPPPRPIVRGHPK